MYKKSLAVLSALMLVILVIGCDVEDTTVEAVEEQDVSAAPSLFNLNRTIAGATIMDGVDISVEKADPDGSPATSLLPFGRINLVSQYIGPDIYTRYPENKEIAVGDYINMSLLVTIKRPGYVKFLYVWLGEEEALIYPESSGDIWHCIYLPEAGTYNLSLGLECPDEPGNWAFFGGVKFSYAPWLRDWGIYAPSPFPFIIVP
ncbi:hypothetical protein GF312_04565 [Candidatus Poribacteria bacterium]|nr:hypothetical protein [Candidatus Poribacteria bacterium]